MKYFLLIAGNNYCPRYNTDIGLHVFHLLTRRKQLFKNMTMKNIVSIIHVMTGIILLICVIGWKRKINSC